MPIKKCPCCDSTKIVKIQYGYPSFEASQRKDIFLGGCCFLEGGPTKHCKTCKLNFGAYSTGFLERVVSFDFYVGGYFGTSHHLIIKDRNVKYWATNNSSYDNKSSDDLNEVKVLELKFNKKTYDYFLFSLAESRIDSWKVEYIQENVYDGTQWHLILELKNGNVIEKHGSNAYPIRWEKFIRVLQRFINKDIK